MVRLPFQLGPYVLDARLGEGGMAEVFRGRSFGASGFEKRIVIKTLREEWLGNARYERMFLEEARLQATLTHRGLVQAHDCGISDGRPWVRLDYVDGVDLSSLHLPLPTPLATFIISELALALVAVHEATDLEGRPLGIVHRDVSSKNVLISRRGEVKLADFGIARATMLKDDTRSGVRKGTFAYMSPEQVQNQPVSASSDQFSLATLAVELLSGQRPFDAATPFETLERICEFDPPLTDIGPHLRPVLLRALSKPTSARFESMRALRQALLDVSTPGDELLLGSMLSARAPKSASSGATTRIETDAAQ